MSEGETKLADQRGKFAQVVKDGQKVPDIEWVAGRILLSSKRIVLVSEEGKRTIPLANISSIKGRENATNPLANVSNYLSLQVNKDVTLVSPKEHSRFEQALYCAMLDQQVVAIKHPAVEGGVVQGTDWAKGRLTVDFDGAEHTLHGEVALAVANGQFVEIEIDDIGTVEEATGDVMGDERHYVEVSHTVDATAVETHVSGPRQKVAVLASLLRKGEVTNETDVSLDDEETEVLMALYSGVSPFEIPDFVGIEPDRVEEIYEQLIAEEILEERRVRREVKLKARGRTIASESMDDA